MKNRYCAMLLFAGHSVVAGSLSNVGNIHLKGYIGDRLDAMISHQIVERDIDYITAPFAEKTERTERWQSEFWGKYMHAAMPYLVYTGSGKLGKLVDRGVDSILASQEQSGYIGNYPDELRCGEGWDVWGMKYTMMGLLHYYDWKCKVESVKCKVAEELCSKIERGIERILASQEPCGYIGNYPEKLRCGEGWDVWGMKYTMLGLIHYHDYQLRLGRKEKAAAALKACSALCDYIIGEIGPNGRRKQKLWQTGNWSGYASSSILESVMWLYNRTKDEKYFSFAAYIVKGMEEPEMGPRLIDLSLKGISVADRNSYGREFDDKRGWSYVCKYGRDKAYEMMSCYQGLLEYCQAARAKGIEVEKYVKAAIFAGEDIIKEEVDLAGGCASSEAWFHGAKKQHKPYTRMHETCVTTTWMRFCEKLLEVTGQAKWADEIEKTFYNAYLGALRMDGGEFAAYTPLSGTRWIGMHHCFMHTDCCTANGPRGFLCFLKELFTTRGDAATFNFYSSALVKGELSGGRKVAFDMYSLYPRTDYARIVSRAEGAATVRLRIPAWSAKTVVKLNGKALDGVRAGGYFTIDRDWKLGDIVEIKFSMPVVAHTLDHHIAFTRGPVLLARDSRFADGDMTEPFRRVIKDGQIMPTFAAVRTPSDDIWMAFSATLPIGSHHENPEASLPTTVFFCDYASAGNKWTQNNYYRTWFPVEYGPEESESK